MTPTPGMISGIGNAALGLLKGLVSLGRLTPEQRERKATRLEVAASDLDSRAQEHRWAARALSVRAKTDRDHREVKRFRRKAERLRVRVMRKRARAAGLSA